MPGVDGGGGQSCAGGRGEIDSDLQRGFIRREVIRFEDLESLAPSGKPRSAGLLRTEGKGRCVVQDGGTSYILFNV